jgi:hypothetical protein
MFEFGLFHRAFILHAYYGVDLDSNRVEVFCCTKRVYNVRSFRPSVNRFIVFLALFIHTNFLEVLGGRAYFALQTLQQETIGYWQWHGHGHCSF